MYRKCRSLGKPYSAKHCAKPDSAFPPPGAHPGWERHALRRPRYRAPACCVTSGCHCPSLSSVSFPSLTPTPTTFLTGEKGVCQPGVRGEETCSGWWGQRPLLSGHRREGGEAQPLCPWVCLEALLPLDGEPLQQLTPTATKAPFLPPSIDHA